MWKNRFMVMNVCPSNVVNRRLRSDRSDAGDTVGTEWILAHPCPTEPGFKLQARVQWWQSAPSPTHFLADWKLCNQGQKTPEIQGKDLAGPQLFSSAVHPLCLTSSGCGNGYSRPSPRLGDVTPGVTQGGVRPGLTGILVILTLDWLRQTSTTVLRQGNERGINYLLC